jgi:hypothetical protein
MWIDQTKIIGSNRKWELPIGTIERSLLLFRGRQKTVQLFLGRDPMEELPMPVIPLGQIRVRKKLLSEQGGSKMWGSWNSGHGSRDDHTRLGKRRLVIK